MGEFCMYCPKEDFQILVDLGLTLLQAKVFLALLVRGTSKVTEISQVSKVSRPDVYRSLSKLQEFGLVEKEGSAGDISISEVNNSLLGSFRETYEK